jgi:hypothetical protein
MSDPTTPADRRPEINKFDPSFFMSAIKHKIAGVPPVDPSLFRPMEITFSLGSPVMLTYPWVMFDGILALRVAEDVLGEVFNQLPRRLPLDFVDLLPIPLTRLPFIRSDGSPDFYYAGSVSRFPLPTMGSRRFVKHPAFDDIGYCESPQRKYRINGGEFKPHDKTLICNNSPTVSFWATGDIDKVKYYLADLVGLGKRVPAGNGRIMGVSVKEIPDDLSIEHPQFGLNRPLPVSPTVNRAEPVAFLSYKAPYWNECHQPCHAPGGF